MSSINKHLAYILSGIVVLGITSCGVSEQNQDSATSSSTNSAQLAQQLEQSEPSVNKSQSESKTTHKSPSPSAQDAETATVTIYHIDNQCNDFVPQQVAVPKDNILEAAVGKVIDKENSSDVDLAGYRVKINPQNGTATVDLRLAANSKRQFVSLSSCEQFALFGSLRKTLTENPQWQVKDVIFTEQGQEILL